MPRSVAKSQASKSQAVPLTLPPMQEPEYIIPGRITKAQWTNMLSQEETDEVVGEIVDELLNKVMEVCLKAHVKSQLIPYCTSWAESYFTRILEQQILCPDESDKPEEAPKPEDTEPFPAICDPWAQGCVPVISATTQQVAEGIQVPAQTETKVTQQCNDMGQGPEKETISKKSGSDKQCNGITPPPPPTTNQRKKQPGYLAHKSTQGKFLPVLSHSAHKMDMEVESKNGIFFSQPKVIDNAYTKANPRKTNRISILESKFTKSQNVRTVATLPSLTSSKD